MEIAEIMNAIKDPHPELFDAINSRIEELKAGTAKGEETKRQRVEEKERKKAFAQENRERRERVEQQKTGQRTLSDGIARQIMTAPPAALFATVQDRKHGKRNPPGQGKRGFKGKDAEGKEEGGEQ